MSSNIFKKALLKYSAMSDVAKATFAFFICNIVQKCVSLITTPIFSRLLSTEQYGIYSTYISWLQILTIIVTFRLDYGIFNKGMSKYPDKKDEYTSTMQGIMTILTTICLVIYLIFHKYINAVTELSTFLSIAMFFEVYASSAMTFWLVRQRYDFKYKSVIAVSLSMVFLNAGLGVIAVILFNHTGVARIISSVLVQCCFGYVIYIYNYKRGKVFLNKEFAKFAILFNIPLLPHYFASYILDQFDRIMIMKIVGYSAVGIYSIAYSSGFVLKIVTNSLNNTIVPWQYRKLKEKEFKSIEKCISSILGIVLICFMCYMTLAPEVTKIFGSKEYYDAMYILPLITASVFFIFLYELFANIEFYYDANKFTMYIAIIGAILNIVLNYFFIRIWGYRMAAYTTLLCYIYFCVAHYIYMSYIVKKNTGKKIIKLQSILPYAILNVCYSILIQLIYPYKLLRYIVFILLVVFVFIFRNKLFEFIKVLNREKLNEE